MDADKIESAVENILERGMKAVVRNAITWAHENPLTESKINMRYKALRGCYHSVCKINEELREEIRKLKIKELQNESLAAQRKG